MYTEGSNGAARRGLRSRISRLAYRAGLSQLVRGLGPRSLSVVNYHRIGDIHHPGFDSFKPNISAHPDEFDRQMAYLKRWFNVITISQLIDWLDGRSALPSYSALITFDDGYLDNYTHAYPILQKHALPALIFLTTGHIGTRLPFPWDIAAYCFYHTSRDSIALPGGRELRWKDRSQLDEVIKTWVEGLKPLPAEERDARITLLPNALDVSIPEDQFRSLMLNWDWVREMRAGGVSFGGHTVTHPILTRIPTGEADEEIRASKARIEAETGVPALGFAYPNGMSGDFSGRLISAVRAAGYRAAFTLLNGPASRNEARERPYEIRRIFISHRHSMPDFAMLLSPLNRIWPG